MAIQIRRGLSSLFNGSNLKQGELAVTTDTDALYYKGSNTKRVQTKVSLARTQAYSDDFEIPANGYTASGITINLEPYDGDNSYVLKCVTEISCVTASSGTANSSMCMCYASSSTGSTNTFVGYVRNFAQSPAKLRLRIIALWEKEE